MGDLVAAGLPIVFGQAGAPDLTLAAKEMLATLGPCGCRVSGVITAEMKMTQAARQGVQGAEVARDAGDSNVGAAEHYVVA